MVSVEEYAKIQRTNRRYWLIIVALVGILIAIAAREAISERVVPLTNDRLLKMAEKYTNPDEEAMLTRAISAGNIDWNVDFVTSRTTMKLYRWVASVLTEDGRTAKIEVYYETLWYKRGWSIRSFTWTDPIVFPVSNIHIDHARTVNVFE